MRDPAAAAEIPAPEVPEWVHLDPGRERLLLCTESLAVGRFHARRDDPSFTDAGQVHNLSMRSNCRSLLAGRDAAGVRRLGLEAHRELLELEILAAAGGRGCEIESWFLALASELLGCASESQGVARDRELVEDAKAYMAERLEDSPSLAQVSRAVGTTPSHLCRLFSRHEKVPAHRWRVEHRLHVALDRLVETSSLSDLAFELGFSSHSHFTSTLRQKLGLAPSQVRSRLHALRSAGAAC